MQAKTAIPGMGYFDGYFRDTEGNCSGSGDDGGRRRPSARRPGRAGPTDAAASVSASSTYLTLPAVRPPTRRFSMIMKRITTGMIATMDTPNT